VVVEEAMARVLGGSLMAWVVLGVCSWEVSREMIEVSISCLRLVDQRWIASCDV
jgi:hypothetical protein